jgi:AcrR family transcriptional regulator
MRSRSTAPVAAGAQSLSRGTKGARSLRRSADAQQREQISDVQRARMLSAMTEAAVELGFGNVTVADVVARSGVSRRTFYEHFTDREQCLLAALDVAIGGIATSVVPAYQQGEGWRARVRAGLVALLGQIEAEPHQGRLAIVQALGAGPAALERRDRVLTAAIAAIDEGRGESGLAAGPPSLAAEAAVGAVLSVLHARLLQEHPSALVELTNELMAMIVLPYLGAAAARRELARPDPPARARADSALGSLRELDMRLTYRTMRVLFAIGSHPGASNRRVAEASDIHDQGQVSKLLRRLQALGLIRNAAKSRPSGEPNAWTLTERGALVREAISAQTTSA